MLDRRTRLVFLLCLLAGGCVTQEPASSKNTAFLIIGAVSLGGGPQPTWIALRKNMRGIHVPASEAIVQIDPDSYLIVNIDFVESKYLGHNTRQLRSTDLRFKCLPDSICSVGKVTLDKSTVYIEPDVSMLDRACKARPDLMETLPVYFAYGESPNIPFDLNCNDRTFKPRLE